MTDEEVSLPKRGDRGDDLIVHADQDIGLARDENIGQEFHCDRRQVETKLRAERDDSQLAVEVRQRERDGVRPREEGCHREEVTLAAPRRQRVRRVKDCTRQPAFRAAGAWAYEPPVPPQGREGTQTARRPAGPLPQRAWSLLRFQVADELTRTRKRITRGAVAARSQSLLADHLSSHWPGS